MLSSQRRTSDGLFLGSWHPRFLAVPTLSYSSRCDLLQPMTPRPASERLRELAFQPVVYADGDFQFRPGFSEESLRPLLSALPLIAAEVKAAEDVLHEYHLWAEDANDGEFAIWSRAEFMAAFHRLQMAFNALREALEEK